MSYSGVQYVSVSCSMQGCDGKCGICSPPNPPTTKTTLTLRMYGHAIHRFTTIHTPLRPPETFVVIRVHSWFQRYVTPWRDSNRFAVVRHAMA